MIRTNTTISNKLGLHARASAKLTKLAGSFPCDIWISRGDRRVNAKSIMGVMMLAAGIGSDVTVEISGEREQEAMDALLALIAQMGPKEAPHELTALLDVHLMLLQDEDLISGVKHWITERLYNAEWALTTQLEVLSRQFDDMEDDYLRGRKADLEQVAERILRYMKGVPSPVAPPPSAKRKTQ